VAQFFLTHSVYTLYYLRGELTYIISQRSYEVLLFAINNGFSFITVSETGD